MASVRRSLYASIVAGALGGCALTTSFDGLSGGGAEDDAGATEGGTPAADGGGATSTDGGGGLLQDAAPDVVNGCDLTGCFDMPQGFQLVAYGANASATPCPNGFSLIGSSVEGPSVEAGACTCGSCQIGKQPTCANGTLVGRYGGAGDLTCPTSGGNLANTNNGCGTDGFLGPFATGNEHRYTPPAASGAQCSVSAVKNNAKLDFAASGRLCQASVLPQCEGKTCAPQVAGGYAACIATDGDVSCPSGFPEKHLVGSGATFSCSDSCGCNVTATCKGTLDYYASADCSGNVEQSLVVDNLCHSTDYAGVSYGSHKYVANAPTNVSCNKTGSSTPSTPQLTDKTTVCCTN